MAGTGNGERDNALKGAIPTLDRDRYDALLAAINKEAAEEAALAEKRESLKMFAPRHPNSQRFHQLLKEAGELHDAKQSDYGRGNDPFANVRASEEWGIDGWVGAMVRAQDKVRRLQTFAQRGSLVNESVKDSLLDLAVYALIALVLFEEQQTIDRLRDCRHIYEVDGCVPCDEHKKGSA